MERQSRRGPATAAEPSDRGFFCFWVNRAGGATVARPFDLRLPASAVNCGVADSTGPPCLEKNQLRINHDGVRFRHHQTIVDDVFHGAPDSGTPSGVLNQHTRELCHGPSAFAGIGGWESQPRHITLWNLKSTYSRSKAIFAQYVVVWVAHLSGMTLTPCMLAMTCSEPTPSSDSPSLGARLASASRRAQGLPVTVTDLVVLERLRGLCDLPRPGRPAETKAVE